jgi:hypothetical protein
MSNREFSGVLGDNLGKRRFGKKSGKRVVLVLGFALTALFGASQAGAAAAAWPKFNKDKQQEPETTIVQPEMTPLEQRAAAYVQFRSDIDLLSATVMDSAHATRDAHNRLASHSPDKLSSGWVAYAALVAADNSDFANSVNKEMARLGGRDQFLSALRQDPSLALNLDGSKSAIDDILQVTAMDAYKIKALADSFIAEAYTLQKKSWAKRKISPGMARVDSARSYSYSRASMSTPILPASTASGVIQPGLASADAVWAPDWAGSGNYASRASDATPILARALVLAARYSVGDVDESSVSTYARNNRANKCLVTAKLNLDQCVAATRTPYEEMFCLGTHGLQDVASCVGHVAGVSGN